MTADTSEGLILSKSVRYEEKRKGKAAVSLQFPLVHEAAGKSILLIFFINIRECNDGFCDC